VFHDPNAPPADTTAPRRNFVEYGRRLEALLASLSQPTSA